MTDKNQDDEKSSNNKAQYLWIYRKFASEGNQVSRSVS